MSNESLDYKLGTEIGESGFPEMCRCLDEIIERLNSKYGEPVRDDDESSARYRK